MAVDPDNLNGYTNATGFPLTAADRLRFNRLLALGGALARPVDRPQNRGDQAAALEPDFNAAVVEQCVECSECPMSNPFVAGGKPVIDVEYSRSPSVLCSVVARLPFANIGENLTLDAYRTHC